MRNLLLLTCFIFISATAFSQQQTAVKQDKHFAKVDSAALRDQSKTALKLIEELHSQAKKQGNTAMLIKAVLYRNLFQQHFEEENSVKIIAGLKTDIQSASQPAKSILQSLLAEMYSSYYLRNSYRIYERTTLQADSSQDIRTWSVNKIKNETMRSAMASLSATTLLQTTHISILNDVLLGDTATRSIRPTLYDLLAQRALEAFTNPANDLSDQESVFTDPQLFGDAQTFCAMNLPKAEPSDFPSAALTIFQQLLRFHASDKNRAAIADIDLKRLKFIYQLYRGEDKDQQYLKALQTLGQQTEHLENYADVIYEQAIFYKNFQPQSLHPIPDNPDLVKAIAIAQRAIQAFPESIGAENARNLIQEIKTETLSVEIKEFNLPDQPVPLLFSYKNIDSVYLKLYKLPLYDRDNLYFNISQEKDYQKFLSTNKAVKTWAVALSHSTDYQRHTLQDQTGPLAYGRYLLLAANRNDSSATVNNYTLFQVTGMTVTDRYIRNDQREYVVTSSSSGQPLKNVNILRKIYRNKDGKEVTSNAATLKTNEKGTALSTNLPNTYVTFITQGKDSLVLQSGYYREGYRSSFRNVILFTDRPIYRPGQTVFYKGIYLSNTNDKNSILPAEELRISFKDVNEKELETTQVTTNAYGTFKGSFNIPTGKLNGEMQISTTHGSITVQVEEYKRPSFEVLFSKADQQYKVNDSIRVKGNALSFAGYPLTGARVKYTVSKTTDFESDYFYLDYPRRPAYQISAGKTETTTGGSFELSFFAKADPDDRVQSSYEIKAEITDISGETQTAIKIIRTGKRDISLYTDLPDRIFSSQKNDTIPFTVHNLNDEPIQARLKADWMPLKHPGRIVNSTAFQSKPEYYSLSKEEFLKVFPLEEYKGDSDPASWETGKPVLQQSVSAAKGKGEIVLQPQSLSPGYYKVRFTAVNASNDSTSMERIVRIFPAENTPIFNLKEWLVTEKTTISPSESAVFRIAGALPEGTAYYEVLYKDKIADRVWIKTSPQQTLLTIAPQPYFEDSFAVQFTMIQNGVVYNTIEQIQIADPAKQLDIKFLSFRDKLQPGEKEKWKLKISSKTGEKQMAELVATLYDASLDQFKSLDWGQIPKSADDYYRYIWNFSANSIVNENIFWFLDKPQAVLDFRKRSYEQLGLTEPVSYGEHDNDYTAYRYRLDTEKRKILSAQALKKMTLLEKGNLHYGLVTNEKGDILPGVTVFLGKKPVLTDRYGIYAINAKIQDILTFKLAGYSIFSVRLKKERKINVTLYPSFSDKRYEMSAKTLQGKVAGITVQHAPMAVKLAESTDKIAISGASKAGYSADKTAAAAAGRGEEISNRGREQFRTPSPVLPVVIPRTNFNETAFFYPQLLTDEAGEINIEFTIPQSLTRYRMMGFAHTKDLKTAVITRELITQKQLAIAVNAARFFRSGDTLVLSAKLNNLSGKKLDGTAVLELKNALTGKVIQLLTNETTATQKFSVADQGNQVLKWPVIIPEGLNAITYKVLAQSGSYSDGEEMTIPVLTNSMLVTERISMNLRGNTSQTFKLDKLLQSGASKTLRNQGITFEFTSNPAWYAIQSLPYLMEYPYECAEQTFSRFYANSFATSIMNSSPKIKAVFNQWRQANNGVSLVSNLEKNPELKAILLEETPWVRAADNESERKKRLAVLFDLNYMSYELKENFKKLEGMQLPDGSFPWFQGMNRDRYITQHIVLGMGQLKKLHIVPQDNAPGFHKMLNKAIIYLDAELLKDYQKELKGRAETYLPLHYLYARSYTSQQNNNAAFKKAIAYYLKKIAGNWRTMEPYQQAQAALVLSRSGNQPEALKVMSALKDKAQQDNEMGMYWTNNRKGWWWYQSPVETQAILIEAFDEVATDSKSVEELKIWLLKNKQTNSWETTKATTAACYALLKKGQDLLSETAEPSILIGDQTLTQLGINPAAKEAGTGYQQLRIPAAQVKPELGKIAITNNSKGIAWGAFYWQYFEQLDKITPAETGVKIKKQLFIQSQTGKAEVLTPLNAGQDLHVGDLLKVRVEIYADRDMEYVHLKDMRSAGFEPLNVLSGYRYQDGLGYYENTKDASTNFFISRLNKGVHVFEYALRVSQAGNFSNGITSLQCMYAPEFATHSEGIRVKINP